LVWIVYQLISFFFFFSSRRRHTRFDCDWSSDVCSSDLERSRQRIVLAGDPPSPINPPAGCAFHPRCPYALEKCRVAVPPLLPAEIGRASCRERVSIAGVGGALERSRITSRAHSWSRQCM